MGTAIIVAAIAGFVFLLAATVVLVALNWSEKTLAPVLSILLVGTATTLAAVLVSLKRSTIESAFPASVVLDINEGAPPLIIPDPHGPRVTSRLSEFVRLGHPAINRDGKTIITIEKPANEDQRFKFCGELLQYHLLQVIEKLQRGGWAVGQTFGVSTARVNRPMRVSKMEDFPGSAFLSIVASNRFSNSDMERFRWQHSHLPLPQNTRITLIHANSSPGSGPEKHIVRLEKPLFFVVDLVVEPLGATGMGVLPEGVVLPPESAANCQTYHFQITMLAKFERITAGNWQTQEYKDWVNWLFAGLRDNLED